MVDLRVDIIVLQPGEEKKEQGRYDVDDGEHGGSLHGNTGFMKPQNSLSGKRRKRGEKRG